MIALSVKDLTKDFGKIRAVDGVSFNVEEGEIFGLIGPNGAGKTTTLRIVSTLLEPTAGGVKIFEYDVVKDSAKVRNLISYLPEEAGAYKKLKGLAYLNFMAGFYAKTWSEKEQMVEKAVAIASLGERIKDKVEHYSKGMVRKLLVARALMHNPKIAILDEPTSGLDVLNSLEVRDIIIGYAKRGTTVLLSSHNMLEVEFLSTRVALINKGRILQTGIATELKKKYDAKNLEEVFVRALKQD